MHDNDRDFYSLRTGGAVKSFDRLVWASTRTRKLVRRRNLLPLRNSPLTNSFEVTISAPYYTWFVANQVMLRALHSMESIATGTFSTLKLACSLEALKVHRATRETLLHFHTPLCSASEMLSGWSCARAWSHCTRERKIGSRTKEISAHPSVPASLFSFRQSRLTAVRRLKAGRLTSVSRLTAVRI